MISQYRGKAARIEVIQYLADMGVAGATDREGVGALGFRAYCHRLELTDAGMVRRVGHRYTLTRETRNNLEEIVNNW